MTFMEGILRQNKPIWDKCIATKFVQDMKNGKLPIEDFKEYIVQDSIYLKNYARVYGRAIYHAETLREIQLYYSILNFVTDTESVVRLNYLRQFGMTDDDIEFIDPLPENRQSGYIRVSYLDKKGKAGVLMVALDTESYAKAIEAHQKGLYVSLEGTISEGNRNMDCSSFSIIAD